MPSALRGRRAELVTARAQAREALTITYPEQLPVSARRDDLLAAIRDHQVVVVAGETGSGKTTQLPKLCLELGRGVEGMIGHTQPRRLAARTVAQRIADELAVPLGGAVGYGVRFDDRASRETLVRLVTDGLLLAEVQRDRLLRRYDTIIVDEAHERSLNIDFLLGQLHRILPRRPDLKLLITSATIDPGRFAEHFGGAPVVEVSGRTHPVEVRYRPVEDPEQPDRDQTEAIVEACEELLRDAPGDVLVFLSGEREIRDTAEVLRGRLPDAVEVLPLYARLATAEQQRVFQPHRARRVVLATNVAETSLTVPGIRSVVDPGTARISRYSARLKHQRLPIERVSRASADQRKGRCGREADGICIRLYTPEDFEARPAFTDPEVVRTNLASVLLQMAALDLGAVEDFPFLDPPDRRQVRDGLALLRELGALDAAHELTKTGRRLATLPVDPRFGRMVLEADGLDCAEEVIVIAAALSIQDPRERPLEHRAHADQLHARFRDESSDVLGILNVWRYLRELQADLSGSQFRKRLKAEYLHYLRVREWQDLAGTLRSAARAAGVRINQAPAEPPEIHRAVLAGLLSHVGLRDAAKRDYLGARGIRFVIQPGSVLAGRGPAWVMVAELVETARLYGRVAARIDPAWIEPLAGDLVKRTYEEPHWERRRGAVVARERVTLYGLPIVAGRTVAYARIDPVLSRELFIRQALVEGDWDTRHHFFAENARRLAAAEELEHRARRRGLVAGDQELFDFYAERIPERVVSAAHFDRWWRDARRTQPDLLTLPMDLLLEPDAEQVLDPRAFPPVWRQGELDLRLSYRFEPGTEQDGVTVHVPLAALGAVRDEGFDWLVPGLRAELVTTLLRSLPKDQRRALVPMPATAAAVVAGLRPRHGTLRGAVVRELERVRGVAVDAAALEGVELPPHLRLRFVVEDDRGAVLGAARSLDALRAQLRPRLRAELGAATRGLERTGATGWDFGTLPAEVSLERAGGAVRAYPALVDEGATVGVRVHETADAAAAAHRCGQRRLLLLSVPGAATWVRENLDPALQLALATAPHGSPAALLDDALVAAADALTRGRIVRDAAAWAALRDDVAGSLAETALALVRIAAEALTVARRVTLRMDELTAVPLQPARADVGRQLRRLLPDGFLARTGAARLPDVVRYLRAAELRLERLRDTVAADSDKLRVIHELEAAYAARLRSRGPAPEVMWLLEELRVASFAPALRGREPVSAKRVRRAIDA